MIAIGKNSAPPTTIPAPVTPTPSPSPTPTPTPTPDPDPVASFIYTPFVALKIF